MSRTRMEWDWVGDYPVFVYMTFITHFKWSVCVVIGKKGDQNAEGYGPRAKPDLVYIETGLCSRAEVCEAAMERVHAKLNIPKIDWETVEVVLPTDTCIHCGADAFNGEEIKHHPSCDPSIVYNYDTEDI